MSDLNRSPTSYTWQVPISDGNVLNLDARPGEAITVVGANGAGKSALATWIAERTEKNRLRRVLAQRRVWIQSSGPSISPAQRESSFSNMEHWDRSADSRFLDHADAQRGDIAMFDLLGKIGSENRRASDLLYGESLPTRSDVDALGTRVSDVLNSVLERSGILVSIQLTEKQTFSAKHRALGVEYPIVQMSDGERSALLLAAEVLVAVPGSVIMLDEPERHLHRSISARLIEALIDARSDCVFIIFTHDLDLAGEMGTRPGTVYVSLGVTWSGNSPVSWDLQEMTSRDEMPESARRAILGGRKRILFVEGMEGSLDASLYGMLFPEWTVAPSGGCEAVIRNAAGLNSSDAHHWVHAAGIVDGDGRSQEERDALAVKGIYVLSVSEIESLYYLQDVLAEVAHNQAKVSGEDPGELLRRAVDAGIQALGENGILESLAAKLARDQVMRTVLAEVPKDLSGPQVEVAVRSPYGAVLAELRDLHRKADFDGLVAAAPVRDSAFRSRVSNALGFSNVDRYQKAAIVAIANSSTLRTDLVKRVADFR